MIARSICGLIALVGFISIGHKVPVYLHAVAQPHQTMAESRIPFVTKSIVIVDNAPRVESFISLVILDVLDLVIGNKANRNGMKIYLLIDSDDGFPGTISEFGKNVSGGKFFRQYGRFRHPSHVICRGFSGVHQFRQRSKMRSLFPLLIYRATYAYPQISPKFPLRRILTGDNRSLGAISGCPIRTRTCGRVGSTLPKA
jgi:hypothetical protein